MTASSLGRSAMDTHLIEHIIKIAEEKSIHQGGGKALSHPVRLNQQLLKLERELGIPLFRRAKTEMIPTRLAKSILKARGRSSAPKAGPMPKSATLRAAIKGPFPLA